MHVLTTALRPSPQVLRGEATGALRSEDPQSAMMRGLAYGTLTKLCQRTPQHVQSDTKLPTELFTGGCFSLPLSASECL